MKKALYFVLAAVAGGAVGAGATYVVMKKQKEEALKQQSADIEDLPNVTELKESLNEERQQLNADIEQFNANYEEFERRRTELEEKLIIADEQIAQSKMEQETYRKLQAELLEKNEELKYRIGEYQNRLNGQNRFFYDTENNAWVQTQSGELHQLEKDDDDNWNDFFGKVPEQNKFNTFTDEDIDKIIENMNEYNNTYEKMTGHAWRHPNDPLGR